jgi:hypothetical protein
MAKRAKTIDLLRVVDLLQEHITPTLCRAVFGAVRRTANLGAAQHMIPHVRGATWPFH